MKGSEMYSKFRITISSLRFVGKALFERQAKSSVKKHTIIKTKNNNRIFHP